VLRVVRLWTNLLWQPAYLAIIAVHVHGAVPDLSSMSQQRRGIYVDGFRLLPKQQWKGSPEAMIERIGTQLNAFATRLLMEVNTLEKLRLIPARRLLADRMLSLIVLLAQRRPDFPAETISAYAESWLAVLELTGQGSLEWIELAGGRVVPVVTRKGCCLDYLATPGRLCSNCPKQDRAERLGRQLAEWQTA
jgi:siderophore ferric iron reductase